MSKKSDKNLYAYGSKHPLKVLGTFSALASVGEKEVEAEFVVSDGEAVARERNVHTARRAENRHPDLLSDTKRLITKKSLKVCES